jgi:ParB family chromosome partitioning protein
MLLSLDEMAENSVRLLEGDAVVSIDPELLEGSFIADRIGDDETDYVQLREAIRASVSRRRSLSAPIQINLADI